MINRINLILRAKNITARQFAEEIGIQPSGMSHILGGRNNPSLEFISKVLRRYPEIDANWLLLGKGAMYGYGDRAGDESLPASEPEAPRREPTLFGDTDEVLATPKVAEPSVDQSIVDAMRQVATGYGSPHEADDERAAFIDEPTPQYKPSYLAVAPAEVEPQTESGARQLVRMLLIYSDNTFAEYTPQR